MDINVVIAYSISVFVALLLLYLCVSVYKQLIFPFCRMKKDKIKEYFTMFIAALFGIGFIICIIIECTSPKEYEHRTKEEEEYILEGQPEGVPSRFWWD